MTLRPPALARLALAAAIATAAATTALGDEGPARSYPLPGASADRQRSAREPARPWGGGAFGVGLTVAMAAVGAGVFAVQRFRGAGATVGTTAPLRVVGRTNLGGRHALYLVRSGERTLIVGVGPQGPPALLGRLDEDGDPADGGRP